MGNNDVTLIQRAIEASKRGDVYEARGYLDSLDFDKVPLEILTFIAFVYIDTSDASKVESILGDFSKYKTRKLKAQYAYAMATACEAMGDLQKAHKWYLQGYNEKVRMPEFYFDFANFLEMVDNPKGAMMLYRTAIMQRPKYYWALVNLGNLVARDGKDKRAIRINKRALRVDKDGSIANYNIAISYVKMGKTDKAIKYYLKEIAQPNAYPNVYFNLGVLYKDLAKYDFAKYYYLQGIEKLKDSYEKTNELKQIYLNTWYNLVCLYILQKDYKNASECLKYLSSIDMDALDYLMKDEEAKDFIESEEFKILKSKEEKNE